MENNLYSVQMPVKAEFYDCDVMGVVWHGNYAKYMEAVRTILFENLSYSYQTMIDEGIAFPVIKMDLKYVKSLYFGQNAVIKATLLEYIDMVRIKYEIIDDSGKIINKASTTQIAVNWKTKETFLQSPQKFIKSVEQKLAETKK